MRKKLYMMNISLPLSPILFKILTDLSEEQEKAKTVLIRELIREGLKSKYNIVVNDGRLQDPSQEYKKYL